MKRKITALLLATMLLSGCLTACTPKQETIEPEQAVENQAVQDEAAAEEVVDDTIVSVEGGSIQGSKDENGIISFLGVPYAGTTAGENRWKEPQPVEAWEGIKSCTEIGYYAPQGESFNWTGCYTDEYLISGNISSGVMSEDCLNLNIWTNGNQGEKKPVIVYIHGGGNNSGAGSCDVYSGESIAKQDVVYVSINYRVGIFGFLAYKDALGEEVTGNYGLMDQIAALEWVQNNIEVFGGDPSNVTIMGQSAGALDIAALVTSPKAEDLFEHAVLLSYYAMETKFPTLEEAELAADAVLSEYTIAELRSMTMEEIQVLAENTYNPASPCIDNFILEENIYESFKNDNYNKVDFLMSGVTGDITTFGYFSLPDDDGNPFTPVTNVTPDGYKAALTDNFGEYADEIHNAYMEEDGAENVYTPTIYQLNQDMMVAHHFYNGVVRDLNDAENESYVAYFTHAIPDEENSVGKFGAFHTSDVSYWLDYYHTETGKQWAEYDYSLGKTMSGYIVNFAKTGNPNGNDVDGNPLPKWEPVEAENPVGFMAFSDNTVEYQTLSIEKSDAFKAYKENLFGLK